jgi:hypothetical protein
LTQAVTRMGTKAQAARWLYESSAKRLANPSNRYRERHRSLFP